MAVTSANLKEKLEELRAKNPHNLTEYQKKLLKWSENVDRRYAWVILASFFVINCSFLGTYKMYGLVFAKVTEEGIYNREDAAMPIATILTVENVVGPLISMLAYYMSFRWCLIIGTIMFIIGNGASSFTSNLTLDILLIGVLQGVAYAFVYMPMLEVLNSYFIKYRNMALGITMCGSTLSVFAWTPIYQWVLSEYNWRAAYTLTAIAGCMNLMLIPLFKPNPRPQEPYESEEESDRDTSKMSQLRRASIRAITYQNSLRRQSTVLIHHDQHNAPNDNGDGMTTSVSVSPFKKPIGLERRLSRAFQSGTDTQLEMTSYVEPVAEHPQEATREKGFLLGAVKSVLSNPAFHVIWYSELVFYWLFTIFAVIIVDLGFDQGCSREEAQLLLSVQSVGELFGRLGLAMIADLKLISNRNSMLLCHIIMGLLCLVTTQVRGFLWISVISATTAAFGSLSYILLNGLFVDYLGERHVTLGYGFASFVCGILMYHRPHAVGYFRDNLGSYSALLVCLGCSCFIGGFLWLVEPMLSRCFGRKR